MRFVIFLLLFISLVKADGIAVSPNILEISNGKGIIYVHNPNKTPIQVKLSGNGINSITGDIQGQSYKEFQISAKYNSILKIEKYDEKGLSLQIEIPIMVKKQNTFSIFPIIALLAIIFSIIILQKFKKPSRFSKPNAKLPRIIAIHKKIRALRLKIRPKKYKSPIKGIRKPSKWI